MAMHAVICIMNTDTVRGFPPEAAHNGEHPPMLIHLEQVCSSPAIYKLYIPLTGNALKNLNCYVLTDHGESLVIDTGFRNEECRTALMGGLKELGVSPEHTKLFLTHLHSDHCGLAEYFDYPDTTIYMGEAEYKRLQGIIANISAKATWDSNAMLMAEGFPEEDLRTATETNPARIFMSSRPFPVTFVHGGDILQVGGVKLEVLSVPGHTPDQMILYLPEQKILFSGDHVLFDITPNITCWPGVRDPLGDYLKSLDKILTYEIETVFPGHRNLSDKTLPQRIQEIKRHHKRRLSEVREVLRAHPGANAYEVASHLTWSLHGATWETAPKSQQWFAVGETIAHLNHLRASDK